jgi:hypothetical protein
MNVYEIDPTTDERWETFLQNHPQASIFHTRDWLQALCGTYDYSPTAFTTTPPGEPLTNGIPFCGINGFFGKRRLVALPFSDHCEPLVNDAEELTSILTFLRDKRDTEEWDYIEIRPMTSNLADGMTAFSKSQAFAYHSVNLRCSLEELFGGFHKDCVQRKIRRAEHERLAYESGVGDELLFSFYHLLLRTRRYHGVPIQPLSWFRNLIEYLGSALKIQVVSKDGCAVAGILTLRYKHVLVFKYGCMDRKASRYGGMQSLLWRAIEEAKQSDAWEFDLGRSGLENSGLVTFKDRWGATRKELAYLRYPGRHSNSIADVGQHLLSRFVWPYMPPTVLETAGRVLYKHMG